MDEILNINVPLELEVQEVPGTPDEDVSLMIDYQGIAEYILQELLESIVKPEHHEEVFNKINQGFC